eukprot:4968424-Amphidinium_carterae.2
MEHPGHATDVINWLVDRDQQTRAEARSMHLDQWPWGEALRCLIACPTSITIILSLDVSAQVDQQSSKSQKAVCAAFNSQAGIQPLDDRGSNISVPTTLCMCAAS